jgi:hypothetical protein
VVEAAVVAAGWEPPVTFADARDLVDWRLGMAQTAGTAHSR